MAEVSPFRYRAFLSYSHRDTPAGKWLHAALESYRVDNDLVGRETRVGAVPRTLRPIFRDREDFSAGHSLKDQTLAALETSQFLVVLCSPNAARSPYVNEEIRRYKALGRADYVLPVIIAGEPGDPKEECFPPALRFKVGPDGAVTDEREEPIAADARPQADGKDLAKLKVVAGLLGLGLDEIVRRAERARRRRLRNWVAALSILTATFAGLAVWAEINRREAVAQRQYAEQALDAGIRTSNSLSLSLAMQLRNQRGMPSRLVKYLLDQALLLQEKLTSFGRSTPELQNSEARALLEASLTRLTIGDGAGAIAAADRARQIFENLLAVKPDDPDMRLNLGVSYERIADALRAQGNREAALAAYRNALAAAQKLADGDSANAAALNELAVVDVKIGNILLYEEGKLDEALAAYQTSLAIQQKLVERDQSNTDWKRGLGISYERIGDVLLAQDKRDEALAAFQKRLAIAQELAGKSNNTELQRDLSVAYNKIGDVLLIGGKPAEALDAYRKGLAIRQALADSDKDNMPWQRDVAISYNKIGDARAVAGELAEALAAYQAALAIERRLAAGNTDDIDTQRLILQSQAQIGSVLERGNKLDAALEAYRSVLAIAERMTKAHPGENYWQNALRLSAQHIGALAYKLILAREFTLALDAVEQSISLAPDIIWLYSNHAHALMFLDRTDEARALYLKYRGTKDVGQHKSWETVILEDFAELRKARLARPLMDEIEKLFASPG